MPLLQRSPPTVAASSLSLLLFLATTARAQDTDSTNNNANPGAAGTTAADPTAGTASISDLPNLSSVTASSSDSGTSTTAPTTTVTNAPTLSSSANSIFHLSDVPTIAGYGVPTPIVPWTAGAPYMNRSSLPEGTVFIVVGAILGFMGLAVLVWRGLVAWALHRSVRKAALSSHRNDSMLKLAKPNPYGSGGFGGASTMSLERLSAPAGRMSKHAHTNSGASQAKRPASLFFSPTAGSGTQSSPTAAMTAGNNRASTFLPAGYYAAPGAASPGVAPPPTSTLSTLNPLHPSRAGYARQTDYTPSPPESPGLFPSPGRGYAGGHERLSGYGRPSPESGLYSHQQGSNSGLNLHVPGGNANGGRAPSANLEDMFEAHGNGSRERL